MLETVRGKWIRYICDETSPGRFLFSRKDSSFIDTPTIDPDVARQYLDKIEKAEQALTASLYYVYQPAVHNFYNFTLPRLNKSLNRSTIANQVTTSVVKGRILWDKTKRLQITRKGLFICKSSSATKDIPENQLLKLYLVDTKRVVDEIIKIVGTGGITKDILKIKHRTDTYLKETTLRDISLKSKSTPLMHRKAQRNKLRGYTELSLLYRKLTHSLHQKKIETITDLISRGWFEPIRDDDLFEIYILLAIINILSERYGAPFKFSGIGALSRSEVAKFTTSGGNISIFFDQSPEVLADNIFLYSKITGQYKGIFARPRRPDITLRIETGDTCKYLLIEAKMTRNREYVNDSIYKCLGYLKDFDMIWENARELKPKVMLVFPEGDIALGSAYTAKTVEDLEIVSSNDMLRISSLLYSAIDSCNQYEA